DGDACTIDSASGSAASCTSGCAHQAISACASGDGCCPIGCTASADNDCTSGCSDANCAWGCVGNVCNAPIDLALGYYHGCVERAVTGVNCWGWNYYGMLGDGTFESAISGNSEIGRPGVRPIISTPKAAALGLGYNNSCAVYADGTVHCWGHDGNS